MTIREQLKKYMPSFCWQTSGELASMMSAAGTPITVSYLNTLLNRMICDGEIVEKKQRKHVLQYRRKW